MATATCENTAFGVHSVNIRIFNGCEVRIKNSVTRVSRDAKQLSRVTEFSIGTEKPLWILFTFPSTIAFKLEYALLDQFYAKITKFFIKKCSVRLLSKTLTSKRLAENYIKN